jgi:hypothetical protein
MTPFDFINSITLNKQNLMVGTGNDKLAEKEYQSYIVNKGLSNYPDTVLYSNEMNIHNHLDNLLQYSYLLNSIRPMKRWAKWNKKEDVNDMDIVKEYYGFSNEKAKSALSILSLDQLKEIRTKLQRGGINEPSGDISRDKTSKRR